MPMPNSTTVSRVVSSVPTSKSSSLPAAAISDWARVKTSPTDTIGNRAAIGLRKISSCRPTISTTVAMPTMRSASVKASSLSANRATSPV